VLGTVVLLHGHFCCVVRACLVLDAWKFIGFISMGSRGSSATIVTMVQARWPINRGSISSRDKGCFSLLIHAERLVVPASLFSGHQPGGGLASRLKWPGREADYSPPYSAEVGNQWCVSALLPCWEWYRCTFCITFSPSTFIMVKLFLCTLWKVWRYSSYYP
jgi:hypothetical protein